MDILADTWLIHRYVCEVLQRRSRRRFVAVYDAQESHQDLDVDMQDELIGRHAPRYARVQLVDKCPMTRWLDAGNLGFILRRRRLWIKRM